MLKQPLALLFVLEPLRIGACSRERSAERGDVNARPGQRRALDHVRAGARALAQPGASVDYVAAEMEGVIMARTKSQALMHYDGYRVTLTTPGDRVTQITFDLIEAKPTIRQMSDAFGEPEEVRKGLLYQHESAVTGATILILAEPVSMPAEREAWFDALSSKARAPARQLSTVERPNACDDTLVRRRKRVVTEIFWPDPGVVGDLEVTHLAGAQLASIEQEQHVLFGIAVVGHLQRSPVTSTSMPHSSLHSRTRASSGDSPSSSLPPGNSHSPARCCPSARRVRSTSTVPDDDRGGDDDQHLRASPRSRAAAAPWRRATRSRNRPRRPALESARPALGAGWSC